MPSTVYQNVVVEEEMEEEDTAQEETEGQQTLGRGDSIVESPIDRSIFLQISAHITVPLGLKHMQQKE